MSANEHHGRLDPKALSPEQLARVLAAAGWQAASVEKIRADIAAGAPTNADGTVNLVQYVAWLIRQAATANGRSGMNPAAAKQQA